MGGNPYFIILSQTPKDWENLRVARQSWEAFRADLVEKASIRRDLEQVLAHYPPYTLSL